jgi:hypothetical protein
MLLFHSGPMPGIIDNGLKKLSNFPKNVLLNLDRQVLLFPFQVGLVIVSIGCPLFAATEMDKRQTTSYL